MPLYAPQSVDTFIGSFNPALVTANIAWVTGNAARLTAFQVSRPISVSTLYIRVGTQSGNIDVGIYDDGGNRLGSAGTTACPTAAVTVAINMTGTVNLGPGQRYWIALACSNTTAAFACMQGGISAPTVPGRVTNGEVATSMPLPATIVIPTVQTSIYFGIWA